MDIKFIDSSKKLEDKKTIYILSNFWDDGGIKASFKLFCGKKELGPIKILKLDKKTTIDALKSDNILDRLLNISTKKMVGYYSLASKDTYKALYNSFSKNTVREFLKSINDVAYNPTFLEKIEQDAAYQCSFLRGINTKYIKTVLSKAARNYSTGSLTMKVSYKSYNCYEQDYNYSFNFNPKELISTNLHAVIGNNGVGKSRLLRDIALSIACQSKFNKISSEFLNNYHLPSVNIAFSDSSTMHFNNVVYISLSPFDNPSKSFISKLDNIDEEVKEKQNNQITNYFLTLKSKFNNIDNEILNQLNKFLNNEVIKKNRKIIENNFYWDKNISNFLGNTINTYLNILEKDQLLKNENTRKAQNDLKNKFNQMSSGQKNIIIIIILTLANILENSLLIIDEPENYLHPPFTSTLIKSISDILQKLNGAGIIATHSDIVLQELPSECVHILKEEKSFHQLSYFQTYGNSLDSINEKIFGLDMEKTGFYSKIDSLVEKRKINKEITNKLGTQARIYLSILAGK